MCEFQILISEPGGSERVFTEDISFLEIQDDGSIILRGLGIQERVENAIIKRVNTYAEEGAVAKLFKAPIIGDLTKFMKSLEAGSYTPELENNWKELVKKGNKLIEDIKNK